MKICWASIELVYTDGLIDTQTDRQIDLAKVIGTLL